MMDFTVAQPVVTGEAGREPLHDLERRRPGGAECVTTIELDPPDGSVRGGAPAVVPLRRQPRATARRRRLHRRRRHGRVHRRARRTSRRSGRPGSPAGVDPRRAASLETGGGLHLHDDPGLEVLRLRSQGARRDHARVPAGSEDRRPRPQRRRQVDAAAPDGRPRGDIERHRRAARRGDRRLPRAGARPRPGQGRPRQRRGRRPLPARPARPLRGDRGRLRRAGRRLRRADRGAGEGAGADRPARRVEPRPGDRPRDGRAAPARAATATSRPSPAASAGASRSAACCCRLRTCCCSTSRPTTSTRSRWPGSSASSPTTRARSSPSPTTATSSTTSPAGSSSSTAARGSRTRATTPAGSSRSRCASRTRRSRSRRTAARSHASWSGCAPRRRRGMRSRRPASRRTSGCWRRRATSSSTGSRSTSRPGRAWATSSCEAEGVSKGFGDRLLVENLEFSLPPGGIVGVIGPNGAGKTTLFRMIAGEEQPDSGELTVGRDGPARLRRPVPRRPRPGRHRLEGDLRRPRPDPARAARGQLPPVRLVVQLPRRGSAEEGRRPLRRRAQPRPPREAPALGRQPAAARRADERPRRRHAARARGRAPRLRRLRGGDLARPLVPRPDRDAHPRLRGRLDGHLVRGELGGVRRLGHRDAGAGGARAAPDQVQAARAAVVDALVRATRTEPGAEKIGTHDLAVADGAEEMLLDHVVLSLLDTGELIREVKSVPDSVGLRVEEMQLGRIAEPL